MSTPNILLIHNFYRNKGGEDTVVMHEVAALKQAGARVYELYFQNPREGKSYSRLFRFFAGIYFNVSAYIRVRNLVRRHRIDVVHVHNLFYEASPSVLWAARHSGARVVNTLHNYRLFCLNALFFKEGAQCTRCVTEKSFRAGVHNGCFRGSRLQSFFLAAALQFHRWLDTWQKAVDQFIVVNPAMQFYLENLGVGAGRIHLKPNCIADRPYVPFEYREAHYLFAGRLEAEKGLAVILKTWEAVPLQLRIAGDGTMRQLLEQTNQPNIQYLGLLGEAAIQSEMACCRALIFGSRLMEGMPLSIIEAMASGTIVIAQATAVTRMLVADGITGLLYDENDLERGLGQVLQEFEAMSLAQKQDMSAQARKAYLDRYTIREHIRHIEQVYQVKLNVPKEQLPGREEALQAKAFA